MANILPREKQEIGDQDKTVPVLGVPPVDAPEKAVKVAVAAAGRKQQKEAKNSKK